MSRLLYLLILLVSGNAYGQSYYKVFQRSTWKATVNYSSYKAVVPLKPVKGGVDPESDKFYYWFAGNKVNATQGSFSGKLLNGDYTEFYPAGNLKEQGEFKRGLKTGEWKSWSGSGVLIEKINWRNGGKSGSYGKYDTTGRLIEKGRLRHNILHGKLTKYSGKDSVSVTRYNEGIIVTKKTPGYIKYIKGKLNFRKDSTGTDQMRELKLKKPKKSKKDTSK